MGTKIKGIYKGFNRYISQIFVVKEREMEIGYPTDVKHVAHIGGDGPDGGTAPSWMNEFKTGPDFAMTSIGRDPSWSSRGFEQTTGRQATPGSMLSNFSPTNLPSISKKSRRKKGKSSSTSSPKSGSSRGSRSSRMKSMLAD